MGALGKGDTLRLLVCGNGGWGEAGRHSGWSWDVTLATGPSLGPCSSRTSSWPPLSPVTQLVLNKAFLTPPASQPAQLRDFTTPGHSTPSYQDIPTPGHPSQIMPIWLGSLFLSLPHPHYPRWQLPSRRCFHSDSGSLPSPTPMPSFLALECGIQKASGHVA